MSDPTPTQVKPPFAARSGPRKAFLVVAATLAVLLVAGAGFSITGIRYYDAKLRKLPTAETVGGRCAQKDCLSWVVSETPECLAGVCNFLIIGSDSREGFEPGSAVGDPGTVEGQRADSIIVVHEDPQLNRTVVLHIPRDLRVALPSGGFGKIGSTYQEGPNNLVKAVQDLTGLQMNHFVSVNFQGFVSLVNALGGVDICTDRPLVDTVARLDLPEAGCYTLTGGQALAYVRARHIQGDAIPDFSRISRQQQFMRSVINKMLSPGSTLKVPALIDAAQDNLVIDDGLNLYDLRDLTNKLAEVGQGGVTFRVTPAVPSLIDGVAYLELVQPRAQQLFNRIRLGRDLGPIGKQEALTPLSPADISVQVFDAGSGGKAQEVADYLGRSGFAVLDVVGAPAGFTSSEIRYGGGFGKQEAVVASYLPLFAVVFEEPPRTEGADVTVVVGPDFPGIAP